MEIVNEKKIKDKYNIPIATQKFLLQLCWARHDAQWYLKSKLRYGIEEANELNQRVISSMGKIEARHILNALSIKKGDIKTIPEMFKVMNTIMNVIIPKLMKFKFISLNENEGLGIVEKCFIWKEVEKSKAENEYVCACNFRHYGWLEAMGIKGKILPIKRFSNGDNCCEFKFILENDNNKKS
ncbi:MAG: L-2-amino-thiazoline-4-carboxylic acid hydrolase [Candidatus Hermodarchaeota archaeon]